MHGNVSAFLPPDRTILETVREMRMSSQYVDLRGHRYAVFGTNHTWIHNMLPYVLVNCPLLESVDLEVVCPKLGKFGIDHDKLLVAQLIDLPQFSRAISYTPSMTMRVSTTSEEREKFKPTRISKLSITVSGGRTFPISKVFKQIWDICEEFNVLETLDSLSIANLTTNKGFMSYYVTIHLPKCPNVKYLQLEYSQDWNLFGPRCAFNDVYSNLDRLTISCQGVWEDADLEFLQLQHNLKHLTVNEKRYSSPNKKWHSVFYASILVKQMQVALLPPNLKTLQWNRADYDEFYCELSRASSARVEYIDAWEKTGRFTPMTYHRYYLWTYYEGIETLGSILYGANDCEEHVTNQEVPPTSTLHGMDCPTCYQIMTDTERYLAM
ncbi:hypothetical protein ABW19_dt0203712 [Dactylella cylindrospora]|nr:hypothetical protein ABW19_dt0203712 [Dactylella cylindrospora]